MSSKLIGVLKVISGGAIHKIKLPAPLLSPERVSSALCSCQRPGFSLGCMSAYACAGYNLRTGLGFVVWLLQHLTAARPLCDLSVTELIVHDSLWICTFQVVTSTKSSNQA